MITAATAFIAVVTIVITAFRHNNAILTVHNDIILFTLSLNLQSVRVRHQDPRAIAALG